MKNSKLKQVLESVYEKSENEKAEVILNEIRKNLILLDEFYSLIEQDGKFAYFLLLNAKTNDKLLMEIKEKFYNTSFYRRFNKNFQHYDKNVTLYFLKELSKAKTPIFLDIITEQANSDDWEIRREIARILSKYKDERSLELFVYMLDDKDSRVIKEVINFMVEMGEKILPYLKKHIYFPADRMKTSIIDVLNRIPTIESLEYLILLSKDDNDNIKLNAQKSAVIMVERLKIIEENIDYQKVIKILENEIDSIEIRLMQPILKMLLKLNKNGAKIIVDSIIKRWVYRDNFINSLVSTDKKELIYVVFEMLKREINDIKDIGVDLLLQIKVKKDEREEFFEIMEENIDDIIYIFNKKEDDKIVKFIRVNELDEFILEKLNSENEIERAFSIRILSIFDNEDYMQKILYKINDISSKVRMEVLKYLDKKEDKTYISTINDMLGDPEESIQIKAIDILEKYNEEAEGKAYIFKAIDHQNKYVADKATKIVARKNLEKYLSYFNKMDNGTKEKVLKLMNKMEDETQEILERDIKSFDTESRKRAIEILSYVKNKDKFKDILKQSLSDPDKGIRASVVKQLVNVQDRDIMINLLKLLNDPDKRVRANTVEAFGEMNNTRAVKVLMPYTQDKDNRIRGNAIMAIYRLGTKEVIDFVDEMLESEDEYMRASGVYVIGELSAKEKEEKLYYMTNEKSKMVRKNLKKTFVKLGNRTMSEKF